MEAVNVISHLTGERDVLVETEILTTVVMTVASSGI
jgi:hypothetical protein